MAGQRDGPGTAIRQLREMAGMTLTDVAKAADTAVAYLSKVELGQKEPTRSYVAKVTSAIAAHLRDAA